MHLSVIVGQVRKIRKSDVRDLGLSFGLTFVILSIPAALFLSWALHNPLFSDHSEQSVTQPVPVTQVVVLPPQETVTVIPTPHKGRGVEQARATTPPSTVVVTAAPATAATTQIPATTQDSPVTEPSSKTPAAPQPSEAPATNNDAPASSSAEVAPPSN